MERINTIIVKVESWIMQYSKRQCDEYCKMKFKM